MWLTSSAGQIAMLGGGGLGVTTLLSLWHNMMENGHEMRMALIAATTGDVKEARKMGKSYQWGRRAILLSLFYLSPLFLFTLAYFNVTITLPYKTSYSWFGGLFHGQSMHFHSVQGFVFMAQSYADLLAMYAGFYCGIKFKKDTG